MKKSFLCLMLVGSIGVSASSSHFLEDLDDFSEPLFPSQQEESLVDVNNRKLMESIYQCDKKVFLDLVSRKKNDPNFPLDLNAHDQYGNTALLNTIALESEADQEKWFPLLDTLLSLKDKQGKFLVDVNEANTIGITPIMRAAQYQNWHAIRFLLYRPDVDLYKKSDDDMTVFDYVSDWPKGNRHYYDLLLKYAVKSKK